MAVCLGAKKMSLLKMKPMSKRKKNMMKNLKRIWMILLSKRKEKKNMMKKMTISY
jgi:hypothetical protein